MQTYEQFAVGRPLLIAAVARVGNANDGTQPVAADALSAAAMQRERPISPERPHHNLAAALEAAQRSFARVGVRPTADSHVVNVTAEKRSERIAVDATTKRTFGDTSSRLMLH